MNVKKEKINTKLKELGQRLGMNEMEALKSKKTMKTIIGVCLVASAIVVVGLFMATRLDPSGLYYTPPSIKDFSFLGRWF